MTPDLTDFRREPYRYEEVAEDLRRLIHDRHLLPGAQLPPQKVLMKQYGIGEETIRRAAAMLVAEGLLTVAPGRGMRVAPPQAQEIRHLAGIAAFINERTQWTMFYRTLAEDFERLGAIASDYRGSLYDTTDTAGFKALLRDHHNGRFDGLVFFSMPDIMHLPTLFEDDLPRIGFMVVPQPHIHTNVWIDSRAFMERAMHYLSKRGRRRVALLTSYGSEYMNYLPAISHRYGVQVPEHWQHAVVPAASSPYYHLRNLVHLLFHPCSQHPNGLIVTDENMAEQVHLGLQAAGVRVGEDVEVVMHTSYPLPQPLRMPCAYLGYDTRDILQGCMRAFAAARAGMPLTTVLVEPIFEDEYRRKRQE